MNINAAIIDQRLSSVCDEIKQQALEQLNITQATRLKYLAFLYLSVKIILDLSEDEAFECLTEGGGDFGIDAIHLSEEHEGEFTVSLFQAKYKQNLEANANFPEEGIKALINAIRYIFDPSAILENINERLKIKLEEVRSLIRDGYIPQVRALACNNGMKWNNAAQEEINRVEFGDQVTWEYVNHDTLVNILHTTKPVNDILQLSGKAITEDFNFSRVLIGRMAVTAIATLIERHGERLLERNIRRYLGLQGNRVNEAIRDTLTGDEQSNFFIRRITFATNNLQLNDIKQHNINCYINKLGISSSTTAQAILAIWRHQPHRAKFFQREHFGKLYDLIFSDDLNGSQTIIAVLILRKAQKIINNKKEYPQFVVYASYFIAMQMGKYLLKDLNCELQGLTHKNFNTAKQLINQKSTEYFDQAVIAIKIALENLYEQGSKVALQQLAATFRRGDLIAKLLEN
jgi:hypothetical protein